MNQQYGGVLGSAGVIPMQQQFGGVNMQQPLTTGITGQMWNQQMQQQQQPILGNVGAIGQQQYGGVYGGALNQQIPSVLPQNYGNPPASFGNLNQAALNSAQIQQAVPTQQLQAALNQRVSSFGQIGQQPNIGNLAGQGQVPRPIGA